MKKLTKWAKAAVGWMYNNDVSMVEIYELGFKDSKEMILNLIIQEDMINSENIKNDPRLASYLLLQLKDKVKNLGEEEV